MLLDVLGVSVTKHPPKNDIIQDETDHAIVFPLENIEWEFDRQQKGSLNFFTSGGSNAAAAR